MEAVKEQLIFALPAHIKDYIYITINACKLVLTIIININLILQEIVCLVILIAKDAKMQPLHVHNAFFLIICIKTNALLVQ